MTIMQKVAAIEADALTRRRANALNAAWRVLGRAKGDRLTAAAIAKDGFTPDVQTIIRAPIEPGTTQEGNWGNVVAPVQPYAAAWLDLQTPFSAFDRIITAAIQVPLFVKVSVVTGDATGWLVGESMVKPLSSMALTGKEIAAHKAVAALVATRELVDLSSPDAATIFDRSIRAAIGRTTDTKSFSILKTGVSPTASAGSTVAAIAQDFETGLEALATGANARIFAIMDTDNAKRVCTKTDGGARCFPNMTPNGGEMFGVETLVSDGVSAGEVVFVDASQLLANQGTLATSLSRHSTIQFETAPDSPATASTNLISLWQHNMVAFIGERFFGLERPRADSVAVIEGANYSFGGSP